jgi:hypothetical protein
METSNFISEKISRTATIVINEDVNEVFPLFGAFEERKWAPHWEPILIYPNKEIIEEGTTFKVKLRGHGSESESLWIVTKYNTQDHIIQYLVSTSNRYWTITVKCSSNSENESKTNASVTYTYIGLNEKGNGLNQVAVDRMFKNDLKDWEHAINEYLASK